MVNLVEGFIKSIPWGIRKDLDRLLRAHYAKEGYMVIPKFEGFVCDSDNLQYELCEHLYSLNCVVNEYKFSDMLKSDVVVDLGANIGAFALRASLRASIVYAIEPLYADLLKRNIHHNGIDNVYVFDVGISDILENKNIQYGERRKKVPCVPLSEILDNTEGCDFLKTDCEGGEWFFTEEDLKRVRRRIEGELHLFNGEKEEEFWKLLDVAGFDVTHTYRYKTTRLFHAYRRGA